MPSSAPDPMIAAVVVTFNRLSLLQRLIDRLLSLPELDKILVVDNASTDGTAAWLATFDDARVQVRTLEQNLGGAGGFEAGLLWAYQLGADLAWLMDDDGLPTPDCLTTLLQYHGEYDFWGPAVLAEQRSDELCFPVRLPGTATVARTLAELENVASSGVVPDVVIPFNGVLVTRELVERIGSVRAEFFIWGDDVEYLWRAKDAQARIATIPAAHFLHPATDDLGTPMLFGITTYNHSPSDLKHYCMARNNTVNLLTFHGRLHAAAFWAKTCWFYTFVRPSLKRLGLSAEAIMAGLRADFTGHRRFLAPGAAPQTVPAQPGPAGGPDSLVAGDQVSRTFSTGTDPDDIPPDDGGQVPVSSAHKFAQSVGEQVAAVIVTYRRPHLLAELLAALQAQTRTLDAIFVVDNSGDEATAEVLARYADLPLRIDHTGENLGGAGGFHRGMKAAHQAGFDWIWLMDDDVQPAPWALEALLRVRADQMACVREDRDGKLVEKAAVRYDLTNPFRLLPKVATVDGTWANRAEMPEATQIENAAFEGYLVHRRVIDQIGYPDPSYFIFYDDCDFQLRARRAGFELLAVREALMRRAFTFVQQNDLAGWKGYYMYRNLFVVHLRYGTNLLVKLRPWWVTAGVVVLSPLRGGIREATNALRGLRDAWSMRHLDPRARLG